MQPARIFYEKFYSRFKRSKVERLKQDLRLRALSELLHRVKQADKKILICGCGLGGDAVIWENKVTAFDLSFTAIKKASGDFPGNMYLVSDVTRLPFAGGSFDCVVCSEVMEHLRQPKEALSEFVRVLRPGGELIISVPNWISWFGLARALAELILRRVVTAAGQPVDNWFTRGALKKLLEPDFKILEWRGAWYFPPFGKAHAAIPDFLIVPMLYLFVPLDIFLGRIFPSAGSHVLAVRCVKNAG